MATDAVGVKTKSLLIYLDIYWAGIYIQSANQEIAAGLLANNNTVCYGNITEAL